MMLLPRAAPSLVALSFFLVACDSKETDSGGEDAPAPKPKPAASGEADAEATSGDEGSACPGTNRVTIEGLEKVKETMALDEPVTVKKATGWLSGMQGGGKTSKHAYVALASYEGFELGSMGIRAPKNEGEVVVQIDFSSAMKEASPAEQKKVYETLEVPPGDYPPGRMLPETVDVVVFKGGLSGGRSVLVGSGHEGKAVLAKSTDEELCGRFDITGGSGASVEGTFSVKIERDYWE